MKPSLLEDLRAHTHDVHHALHRHPFMVQCFYRGMNLEMYRGFLRAFLLPWQKLEDALSHLEWATSCGPLQVRHVLSPRTPLLCDDLEVMPEYEPSDRLTPHQALGYAYALVGSSQGARVLEKHVRRQLPDAPVRYMTSDESSRQWRDCAGILTELELGQTERLEVLDGALQCFQEIAAALDLLCVRHGVDVVFENAKA